MKKIVIVGARHLGWEDGIEARDQTGSPEAARIVQQILAGIWETHGPYAYVVSLSADLGFGRSVREATLRAGLGFAEVTIRTSDLVPKGERELLWLARHAALVEIGDEFHVFLSSGHSQMSDLIARLGQSNKPWKSYAIKTTR
jgi:hypothetical protein